MAKNRIFTVGFELPGDEFEFIDFDSDVTLLDADIVLFQPTLGRARGYETYNGKTLLGEHDSFNVDQRLQHWRAEITAAVKAEKLVIVYLTKPEERYRHTGKKQHSGTGKSRITTNLVTEVSSYEAIPSLNKVSAKSGTEIQIDKNAKFLSAYWSEFSSMSPYEVEIEGDLSQITLRSRTGNRIIGAAIDANTGNLLFLPPLKLDDSYTRLDKKSDKTYWTTKALQFGKRLVASIGAMANSLNRDAESTPPPSWTSDSQFRLASESKLETEISKCSAKLAALQTTKATLENKLIDAGNLRRLLFEQGKPLEAAILEALEIFGFEAERFANGKSEFDAIFSSAEGRCLGEAEGKDSKAINIDKFSQLERNIQEDFMQESTTAYAKAVLFGNAFRLTPLIERDEFFTDKCIAAAQRVKAALVKTTDLFEPAKYLQENPSDIAFAKKCREAIFNSEGSIVVFPSAPIDQTSLATEIFDNGTSINISANSDLELPK